MKINQSILISFSFYAVGFAAPAYSVDAMNNPYGLQMLWTQGDNIAHTTLFILIAMSLLSWFIICTKFISQYILSARSKAFVANLNASDSIQTDLSKWRIEDPYRQVVEKAIEDARIHSSLIADVDFNEWVSMSIQRAITRIQNRLQAGITTLATIGSTAPFVGLFGTVWGIYHALVGIGISGQASIEKVAGPVGESLIMTAIGLVVAVPAVIGYNMLVRRNKAYLEELNSFGADFHARLLRTRLL